MSHHISDELLQLEMPELETIQVTIPTDSQGEVLWDRVTFPAINVTNDDLIQLSYTYFATPHSQ